MSQLMEIFQPEIIRQKVFVVLANLHLFYEVGLCGSIPIEYIVCKHQPLVLVHLIYYQFYNQVFLAETQGFIGQLNLGKKFVQQYL